MTKTDKRAQFLFLLIVSHAIEPYTEEIAKFRERISADWWKWDIDSMINECKFCFN